MLLPGEVEPVTPVDGPRLLLGEDMGPAGGLTAVEPGVGPVAPMFAPGAVAEVPLAALGIDCPVSPLIAPVVVGVVVLAAAFAGVPVEAIAWPAHQSWLARCRGEARM